MKKLTVSTFTLFLVIGIQNLQAQEVLENHEAAGLYSQYCSTCHGVKMQAFVQTGWKHGTTKEKITASITKGRGGGAMPAWGAVLSEDQIGSLADYLVLGFENFDKYAGEVAFDDKATFTSENFSFRLEKVFEGPSNPWGMTFLPDGKMLITEQKGDLFLVDGDSKTKINDVPKVNSQSQGGLLDVTLHPNYDENGWIYLSYSKEKDDDKNLTATAVSRYRLEGEMLVDGELIFEALPYSTKRHHYGSRLVFDKEGYLFVSVGDRGERDVNPQDLTRHPGKIHRIMDDGSIPDDNPFVNNENAGPSIFSYGHRNPQGMSMNPSTGDIWTHEHGPRGGDELNLIVKEKNYGWPKASFGINYSGTIFTSTTEAPEYQSPVHYWVPSIAPSGMTFVSSDKYPEWKGHILLGSLKFQYLNLAKMDGNEVESEEILLKGIGRVRNVQEGPDGFIYVTVEEPGAVYRIAPE